MKTATNRQIGEQVLAYREGVLESTSQVLTEHDAEQIVTALNLEGLNASTDRVLEVGKPYLP